LIFDIVTVEAKMTLARVCEFTVTLEHNAYGPRFRQKPQPEKLYIYLFAIY